MGAYLDALPGEGWRGSEHPYLAWLRHGRDAGEIADPAPEIERMAQVLDLSPNELVDALVERRTDLQQRLRTGKLGDMFARAAEIDPLIGDAWPESSRPFLLPVTSRDHGERRWLHFTPPKSRPGSVALGYSSWSASLAGAVAGAWRATSRMPSRTGWLRRRSS